MKTTLITLLIIALAVCGYMYYNKDTDSTGIVPSRDGDTTVCTMEAKQCPDGSYVGRSGPNCEFAECPTGASVDANVNL